MATATKPKPATPRKASSKRPVSSSSRRSTPRPVATTRAATQETSHYFPEASATATAPLSVAEVAWAEPGVPEPEAAPAKPAKAPTSYADSDLVTVLHGYGKIAAEHKHYASGGGSGPTDRQRLYEGKGGIYRNVRYAHAKLWREMWVDARGKSGVIILPPDADEVAFARASGIQPLDPNRLAAMIAASDPAALAAALGPARIAELAETLLRAVPEAAGHARR